MSGPGSDTFLSFLFRTTPLLKSLHWLPVCFKIKFKTCLVTYIKALCNNQPIYLEEVLKLPKRTRDLRSSDQNVFFVPRIKTKKGEGSFSVAAPKLWNHLPGEIRTSKTVQSFRKKFKTFFLTKLFRLSYFVSWHAQLVTRNEITTTVLNTSSDFRAYELGTPRI